MSNLFRKIKNVKSRIFLSKMQKGLNLFDMAHKSDLTDEAHSKFYASIKEAGIPLTGVYSSPENVSKASEILLDLLANKSNYKDKEKADLHKEVISAILPELINLKTVLAKVDENGNLTQDGMNMVADSVKILKNILANLDNTDYIYNPDGSTSQ